jgi:hypothetical protein
MVTNNFTRSSLYSLHNVVQNSMVLYPKELVIATLRDYFGKDDWYSYRHDHFGFPQTPDHTDLPIDSGLVDDITTRLFIGESYRFDVVFYPAIIVRHGGSTSVPISFNRETGVVKYGQTVYQDGYGNIKTFQNPEFFLFAGAWEGSITIDVMAKDLRTRDELVQLISLLFTDIAFNDLVKSGLTVKPLTASAPTERDDRNDHVFVQTITLPIRSEWHRHVPIGNIIDVINFAVEFARVDPTPGPVATNLTINTDITITDLLNSL